jgi:hypothetical protein
MKGQNPLPAFKQWLSDRSSLSGKPYSLADASAEIRNNYQRAGDLWEEYQAHLENAREIAVRKSKLSEALAAARTPIRTEPEEDRQPPIGLQPDPEIVKMLQDQKAARLAKEQADRAAHEERCKARGWS